MTSLAAPITGLFVGKVETLWTGRAPSAINKRPVTGPLKLDVNGFIADAQADLSVHGGPEKAIHHYAADHFAYWRSVFPNQVDVFRPGGFGENISTIGLTEENMCIGDILSVGTARLQICQGRQPCWKLAAFTGLDALPAKFLLSGKTGWYYRVLEPGEVAAGDILSMVERPHPQWSVSDITKARFNPKLTTDVAAELADMEVISQSWRDAFARKRG